MLAKTKAEANTEIFRITSLIQSLFPELSVFLDEIPETIPNIVNPEISLAVLNRFIHSLDCVLKGYLQHPDRKAVRNFSV